MKALHLDIPRQTEMSNARRSHKQAVIAHRQIAPIGARFLLKPGYNFPLHMVNGLHLYRAVTPEAHCSVSHSPTTCCSTTSTAGALHLYKQYNGKGKKSIYLRKIPCHGFSLLHHCYFISVCLRPGHSVVPLFSSSSSCFCLPSTQSSFVSCTSVSFSSLVFLSLLLDPQIPSEGRLHSW